MCSVSERGSTGQRSSVKVNGVILGSKGGEREKRRVRVRGGTGGTVTRGRRN